MRQSRCCCCCWKELLLLAACSRLHCGGVDDRVEQGDTEGGEGQQQGSKEPDLIRDEEKNVCEWWCDVCLMCVCWS